ncbi:membrane protein, partial [Intrasporangium oryzae NRRL B-24470]
MPPASVALAVEAAAEPGHLLADLVALHDTVGWTVRTDEAWAHADVATAELPSQGWKLHVSATEASVLDVLAACAAVLLPARTPFKVAATYSQVRTLTSPHCPRGNAGKIVTVYPTDLDDALRLAHLLDVATEGLAGPRILNDRALREGSLVHYRYGVFTGTPVLTHDGELQLALMTPDGRTVADTRGASFTPPAWLTDPFQSSRSDQPSATVQPPSAAQPTAVTTPTASTTRTGSTTPTASAASPKAPTAPARVLLGDRFAVREAIRHANRGGVFRAEDLTTGEAVIVKQARAHVAADREGRDARDRLRHESAVLGQLAPTGLTPRPVQLFEQGGDLFLAESDLGAETLRAWVSRRAAQPGGVASDPSTTSDPTAALDVLRHVAAALRVVHEHGLVLRDLTPNNLLVRADRTVAIIDPELAISADAEVDLSRRSGTAAYAPAEQLSGAAPEPAMDLHALGALVLFVLTGEDPLLGVDGSTSTDAWLDRGSRRLSVPADLADLAVRLTGDPAARPSLDAVIATVDRAARPGATAGWTLPGEADRARHALDDIEPIDAAVADEAIETLLDRLVREISPRGSRVARASAFGETTLPTNVQHGASGLLGVLFQAARLRGDDRARRAAAELAGWVDRAPAPQGGAVGLHFGHAG